MTKRRDTSYHDSKCRKLLPSIVQARALGLRRVDDVLSLVNANGVTFRRGHPLTRSAFYRAWLRLRDLGLDAGPDDLATARRHGRATKLPKKAA